MDVYDLLEALLGAGYAALAGIAPAQMWLAGRLLRAEFLQNPVNVLVRTSTSDRTKQSSACGEIKFA